MNSSINQFNRSGSTSRIDELTPPQPSFLAETNRNRSSIIEPNNSMRNAFDKPQINLKRLITDSGSSLHPRTQQHLDRSMSRAMKFHKKRHDLDSTTLSGLAQKALRHVIEDAHSFSNTTTDLEDMVSDPMMQSLDKALGNLGIEPDTRHVTTAETLLNHRNSNDPHETVGGLTADQLKTALKDLTKSFRAIVPVEDVQFAISDKPNSSINQRFQLPQVSNKGLAGFDAGRFEAVFVDNMMHSSNEAKHSGNAFDLSNETANTGIVTINNQVAVGRSGRTDTPQKVLQILSLNAQAALHSNGNSMKDGQGFVNGEFQMMITSAMDLSKTKAAATGGVQFIKNRLADIQDATGSATRRIQSKYVELRQKINSDYTSNIKPFDSNAEKLKAKYKHVGNNEREQFLQIQKAVDELFKSSPNGKHIFITIADSNGIPREVKFAKPLVTNMTLSNQAKNTIFTGKKEQNDAVTEQQAFNREHALPVMTQRISHQLNKGFEELKHNSILSIEDLERHTTAQAFLSIAKKVGNKEPTTEEAFKLRQHLTKLDNLNSKGTQHLNLVNGLGFIYTQLTKNEFRTGNIQRDRGHEFIQLRSAMEVAGMAHSVQCKSGMDRTLTMAALSVAHKLNPVATSRTDGTIHLKQDFSESVAGLGYKACSRNRGPQIKNTSLMKNLKHEPTQRILDMEIYENKITELKNQNGLYQSRFED